MVDYLKVIKLNKELINSIYKWSRVTYDLFTSKAYNVGNRVEQYDGYDDYAINYHSEILITTPTLLPQCFINV